MSVASRLDPVRHPGAYKWVSIVKKDPCSYCGEPGGTIDHIFPQATFKGSQHSFGTWSWQNLTSACSECNSKKGHTSLLRYLIESRS